MGTRNQWQPDASTLSMHKHDCSHETQATAFGVAEPKMTTLLRIERFYIMGTRNQWQADASTLGMHKHNCTHETQATAVGVGEP
jgi:hypothetical protein